MKMPEQLLNLQVSWMSLQLVCPIVFLIKFCYEQALVILCHIVEFYFVLGVL